MNESNLMYIALGAGAESFFMRKGGLVPVVPVMGGLLLVGVVYFFAGRTAALATGFGGVAAYAAIMEMNRDR